MDTRAGRHPWLLLRGVGSSGTVRTNRCIRRLVAPTSIPLLSCTPWAGTGQEVSWRGGAQTKVAKPDAPAALLRRGTRFGRHSDGAAHHWKRHVVDRRESAVSFVHILDGPKRVAP